ncbi:MAG: hypothetical protein D3920_00830 [Candidatus Electrothrix sp. AW2]|nr:hypothetical protein [Candidatus Electrothrix gigas]
MKAFIIFCGVWSLGAFYTLFSTGLFNAIVYLDTSSVHGFFHFEPSSFPDLQLLEALARVVFFWPLILYYQIFC